MISTRLKIFLLLKQRKQPSNIEFAKFASILAAMGCERVMELGIGEEWVKLQNATIPIAFSRFIAPHLTKCLTNTDNLTKFQMDCQKS